MREQPLFPFKCATSKKFRGWIARARGDSFLKFFSETESLFFFSRLGFVEIITLSLVFFFHLSHCKTVGEGAECGYVLSQWRRIGERERYVLCLSYIIGLE